MQILSNKNLWAVSVYKINVSPEYVQKFLNLVDGSDLDAIQYAPKTGKNPLQVTHNEKGEFVHNGRVIENPSDYVEEHYDDHDYHGQDGLGQYLYGYEDWNQAKNEKKDSSGTVRGAYKYRHANGYEMIVKYYADATGFHAEDNRPAYLKSSPTKTPEVQKAEEDHLMLWRKVAVTRGHSSDSYTDEYQNKEQNTESRAGEYDSKHKEPMWLHNLKDTSDPKGFFYANDFNLPLLRRKPGNVRY